MNNIGFLIKLKKYISTTLPVKIYLSLLIGVFAFNKCHEKQKEDGPNIIIIMADDLGYGDFSCYGATNIQTPNCDRLANEGMKFIDAHSPSAVSTPTRYSLLTGRYNWRSWLKNWVVMPHMPMLIDTAEYTLPVMLDNQSYTTGIVGKWHLGWGTRINPNWNHPNAGPNDVGFDYSFVVPHSHNSPPELMFYMKNGSPYGLKKGEDITDSSVYNRLARKHENTAVELSEKAVDFIKRNKDDPFFLYYPTTNVHFPITPNKKFRGKSNKGIYGDFVVEFDWAVGQVLKILDSLDLTKETIVIVTSDNGERLNSLTQKNGHKPNGELRGYKGQIYEGGHRVPFIARWPGKIKPGSKSKEVICLTDLLATCAALTNTSVPENEAEDSYNLLPVLLDQEYQSPLRLVTIHHSVSGMFAIRKGDWKLINGIAGGREPESWQKTMASGKNKPEIDSVTGEIQDFKYYWPEPRKDSLDQPDGQLYNLRKDPKEQNNLWEKYPEKVKELQMLLRRYKKQ